MPIYLCQHFFKRISTLLQCLNILPYTVSFFVFVCLFIYLRIYFASYAATFATFSFLYLRIHYKCGGKVLRTLFVNVNV